MAKNNSRLTYVVPKEKFVLISNDVITKFEPFVVGVYCKLVKLSSGKSLDLDFIAEKIGVSIKKIRKVIVLLEDNGYITRKPIRTCKGKFDGWDYKLYAEPVSDEEKTHAGKANEKDDGLTQKRTSPLADKSKSGKDIISYNDISYNNKNDCIINNPVLEEVKEENIDISKKNSELSLFEVESLEQQFVRVMKEKYPRIMRMDQPLTYKQSQELKKQFCDEDIFMILEQMENWKPLTKNNANAYKTILNWLRRSGAKTKDAA